MKPKISLLLLALIIVINAFSQDDKKKFKVKVPKLNLTEKIGDLTGNLMTKKTDQLDEAAAIASIISGIYPVDIKTTESKYFPPSSVEGDYMVGITFLKDAGMGMFEIEGDVFCDGKPMEYLGLGSYLAHFPVPFTDSKTLSVSTTAGDKTSLVLKPAPEIDLLKVNDETSLPVIDLSKDITIEFTNLPGSEGSRINVALITDVAGVRALNRFANFKSSGEEIQKVTIPKESLSNPEIAGSVKGVGNYNQGENYLIIEREITSEPSKIREEQSLGDLKTAEIKATAYSSMSVIVKGKQDESVYASLRVAGKNKNDFGFEFYKPNANTGIPFSKGSKFGLVSFTLNGQTYKSETSSQTESWSVGYTRYTRKTTVTTTYEFPQLPDSHWEYFMDKFYKKVEEIFKNDYNIEFVPVENVTGTSQYSSLFPAGDSNTKAFIKTSYKNTQRSNPKSLSEIFGSVSSNKTSDVPVVNMMKEADVDGLVSIGIDFSIGTDKNNKVILYPVLTFSITGRDEENNSKQGKYADGIISGGSGIPFDENQVKSNPEVLFQTLSSPRILELLQTGLQTLYNKEVEMGYDRIWNTGN